MVGLNPNPVAMKFPTSKPSRCTICQICQAFFLGNHRAWETTKITLDNPRIRPSQDFKVWTTVSQCWIFTPSTFLGVLATWIVQLVMCPFSATSGPRRRVGGYQLWLMVSPFLYVEPVFFYSITNFCNRFQAFKEASLKIGYRPNLSIMIFWRIPSFPFSDRPVCIAHVVEML